MCDQKETEILEDRAVQEHDGFGVGIGRLAEVVDVSVWAQAADHGGPGRGVQGVALGADGDFAVIADADAGVLAPDKGPPRAGGHWAQHRAFFGEGLVAGGLGRGPNFAVDFMGVGMREQLLQEVVGATEFADVIGGEERGQTFLLVVVAAFDFTLGLGRGGIAEVHAVEVEGGAQLSEGVGVVGVEEGVVVHVESHLGGPVGMVIATGTARNPGVGLAVGAGVEVLGIELVEAAAREAQLRGGGWGVEMTGAKAGQKVANEGGGTTMS